jgi:hypothetical protein
MFATYHAATGELSEAKVLCIFFFDLGAAFTVQIDVQPHPPFVCFFTNLKLGLTELDFAWRWTPGVLRDVAIPSGVAARCLAP